MENNLSKWSLRHDYSQLPKELYSETKPSPLDNPELLLWNKKLAKELELDHLNKQDLREILSGNQIISNSKPIAQAYGGHQFGHFNILGDGRAILLGELDVKNKLFDLQLKGAGPTKYSRRGDGRATLYSMLREYLISEAMNGLGIASSRSLAVVGSDTNIYRENVHKAGILTRITSSHIRVGTFELAARIENAKALKDLFDYTVKRHYPEVAKLENPALEFLKAVIEKQINLVVQWLSVGFIHGVMNTDNTSIAAETFDYGPCAFMNVYEPNTVYSSIDHQGRYAYMNQRYIIKWNLMRFAETLLPLIHENINIAIEFCQVLFDEFDEKFNQQYNKVFLKKLGIDEQQSGDIELLNELIDWMQNQKADFTRTFRALSDKKLLADYIYKDDSFLKWYKKWKLRTKDISNLELRLNQINPHIIARNHIVEEALEDVVENNNFKLFHNLLGALERPFDKCSNEKFQLPPEDESEYKTFCGT